MDAVGYPVYCKGSFLGSTEMLGWGWQLDFQLSVSWEAYCSPTSYLYRSVSVLGRRASGLRCNRRLHVFVMRSIQIARNLRCANWDHRLILSIVWFLLKAWVVPADSLLWRKVVLLSNVFVKLVRRKGWGPKSESTLPTASPTNAVRRLLTIYYRKCTRSRSNSTKYPLYYRDSDSIYLWNTVESIATNRLPALLF